jgi:hypothetical protein
MTDPKQDNAWSGMGIGWSITSTMIGGMLCLGAIGYVGDRLFGLANVLTGVGIVLGGAVAVYIIYLRYGRGGAGDDGA